MNNEEIIKILLDKIDSQNKHIKELEFRLASIKHCLDSEVSTKRYGEIKKFESNE